MQVQANKIMQNSMEITFDQISRSEVEQIDDQVLATQMGLQASFKTSKTLENEDETLRNRGPAPQIRARSLPGPTQNEEKLSLKAKDVRKQLSRPFYSQRPCVLQAFLLQLGGPRPSKMEADA